jgi:hypothetical protein
MIWKVNTLKEVVVLVFYKSKLSALHGNDLIYLDPDWLKFNLLEPAVGNSYPVNSDQLHSNPDWGSSITSFRFKEAEDVCHIIWYIHCLMRYL